MSAGLPFKELKPLADRPINRITPAELLTVARHIEERGALESAHRTLRAAGMVFRYAVATLRTTTNPADALRGALPPAKGKHYPAITDPAEVGGLLRAIDGYQGSFVVRCALRLAPLVFVRPRELRHAEWAEIDLAAALWVIPAGKMKMRVDHMVPLSRQALAVLEEIRPLTGSGRYVFPGERSATRPMSENTVGAALRCAVSVTAKTK